jgi:hypothetical protein
MYYKGLICILWQIVNDDEKWRTILRGLNSTFIIRQWLQNRLKTIWVALLG